MPSDTVPRQSLIVASNRLPFVFTKRRAQWRVEPGAGGLVTALVPVLQRRGGTWIGWPGTSEGEAAKLQHVIPEAVRDVPYRIVPVALTAEDIQGFYYGFSNEVLWPLLHDLQTRCVFEPAHWCAYRRVNRKYAEKIAEAAERGDLIWVHDYHLMAVARELRAFGVDAKLGFFLHTPFPAEEIFVKLPWRRELVEALLAYDLIGFQTLRDRRNFEQCVRALIQGASFEGRGRVESCRVGNSEATLGVFPISIDVATFERLAQSDVVAEKTRRLKRQLLDRTLILGVDRLDYTKGILERLSAFRHALERYPDLRQNATLIQIAVPSREHIEEYQKLKADVEQLVSQINGRFTRAGWVPVHYLHRQLERSDLVACYRASEIALITSLKDGMNLISKEYCVSRVDEDGVLILSEFAGSAAQLHKGALLVNPYDVEGTAEAIYEAYRMDREEQQRRMRRLRKIVRKYDIHWWCEAFLQAASGACDESAPPPK